MKRSRLELKPRKLVTPIMVPPKALSPKATVIQPHNSPESICVICLDRVHDRSYLNNCLHEFCFSCLIKWSQVKTVCPLCQQKSESVLYNVRSDKDYDEHVFCTSDVDNSPVRVDELLEQVFLPEAETELDDDTSYVPTYIIMVDFRRYVYENRLLSMPLRGNNRNGSCTPQYIRSHQQEVRLRLIPWLNRELGVVIDIRSALLMISLERVLSLTNQWHILSSEFRDRVTFCTSNKTDLFCWELYNFTASFCNMIQFDEEVKYVRPRDLDVPPQFQQFFASAGTTNPMLPLVGPSHTLSLTVQSPAMSASPVDTAASSSGTDSEDDSNVNLHFKTSRFQCNYDGLSLESSRCGGPFMQQAVRPTKFSTELACWSSGSSEYNSEDGLSTRTDRQEKLRKKKNSRKVHHRRSVKTAKFEAGDCIRSNKGDGQSITQDRQEPTTSNNASSLDNARSSEPCSHDSVVVGSNQCVSLGHRTRSPSSSVHVEHASFPRSKRRRHTRVSDDASPTGRMQCVDEAPPSYYQGGFLPFSCRTGENCTIITSSSTLPKEEVRTKKRLSSVIVKPVKS